MARKLLLIIIIVIATCFITFYVLPKITPVPPYVLLASSMILANFLFASLAFSLLNIIKDKPLINQRYDNGIIFGGMLVTIVLVGLEGAPLNPFILYPETWDYLGHPEKFSEQAQLKYGEMHVNTGTKPQYP